MNAYLVETLAGFSFLFGVLGTYIAINIKNQRKERKKIKSRKRGTHAYSAILNKLAAYRLQIEKLSATSEVGVHSHRLEKVMQSFDEWEAHVYRLVDRLLEFEANKIVHYEGTVLPKKIRHARYRLDHEKDPRLQKEIQETLDSYLRQQAQLDNFRYLMEKTQLDLEEIISGIGAVYSQLQTLEAMDVHSRRAQRLAHEIEEERAELDDLLSALDEVYDARN